MAFSYSIVDGFSVAFLLILFFGTRERSTRLTETRCFRLIVLMTVAALLGDLVAWRLDGRPGAGARTALWAANITCYALSGAMPLTWLYYVGLKMNRLSRIRKPLWALIALPAAALAAMAVLTPVTRLLFRLDDGNVYRRGPLCGLPVIVSLGYLLAAMIWTLYRAGRERLHQQRTEYLFLSSFIIFPVCGGVLQFAFYGVSLAWPCTALSLMLVYVSMQNRKISLDALTGLNNRGQLDKHLFNCFERADGEERFALFMLDIDEFKKINDTCGHTVGDAALVNAAGILKRALAGSNAFLARYGGDEFAIVLYYDAAEQIDALRRRIADEAEKHNRAGADPYRLVFSVGYVCYDGRRFSHYQDMITAADAQMYEQKRQHQAVRA